MQLTFTHRNVNVLLTMNFTSEHASSTGSASEKPALSHILSSDIERNPSAVQAHLHPSIFPNISIYMKNKNRDIFRL